MVLARPVWIGSFSLQMCNLPRLLAAFQGARQMEPRSQASGGWGWNGFGSGRDGTVGFRCLGGWAGLFFVVRFFCLVCLGGEGGWVHARQSRAEWETVSGRFWLLVV